MRSAHPLPLTINESPYRKGRSTYPLPLTINGSPHQKGRSTYPLPLTINGSPYRKGRSTHPLPLTINGSLFFENNPVFRVVSRCRKFFSFVEKKHLLFSEIHCIIIEENKRTKKDRGTRCAGLLVIASCIACFVLFRNLSIHFR